MKPKVEFATDKHSSIIYAFSEAFPHYIIFLCVRFFLWI